MAGTGFDQEVIRYREQMDALLRAGLHPRRLLFTRRFEAPMPTQADSAELDRLEDDLIALLEPKNQAVLTLVRTGKRKRQWVFYGADTAEMKERIRQARELILSRKAGLLVESDQEWKLYRDLVPQ